jgi:putative membrane protein
LTILLRYSLGIYRRLLGAITSINRESLTALFSLRLKDALAVVHWRFMVCLGLGVGLALVVMGKLVNLPNLVVTNPKPVYAVFFGLVLASGVLLIRRVQSWNGGQIASLVIGAVIGFLIVRLVPVQTPENPLFLFLCGSIAITAMILPGISGSFMLLILGKYEFIIGSLVGLMSAPSASVLFGVVVPFVIGCIVGISAFSRVLHWLLDNWHDPMLAGLTGLLFGSLWRIWPYQDVETAVVHGKEKVVSAEPFWPQSLEASTIGLVVLGLVLVLLVEWVAQRRSSTPRSVN